MNNLIIAIIIGLIFGYVIIPLFLVYLFCNKFNWENIKKIYFIIFTKDIK
jgi:hypothetical protein